MTDVHSHIIFDTDDGSNSIEESIELLKREAECGFSNIILTPHYIEGTNYIANNKLKKERLDNLKLELKNRNIKINIYLGNEIFISNNIVELIKNDEISSLNNTKYILVELPFHNQINNLEDILYELKISGFIPVIAHPERYTYFQEDYSLIDRLKDDEILFQSNYASILGYYGKKAESTLKYLLKNKYINFLGTDIHHSKNTYVLDNFNKIIKKIKQIAGEKYTQEILANANKLINDKR